MIKTWLITGDTHGDFSRLEYLDNYSPEDTSIIILGDAGVNFYLGIKDTVLKEKLQETGFKFYLVRGNHEQRPELIENIYKAYDIDTKQMVYVETGYPNIRYFIDGYVYQINGYSTLVLGGAYSVDKHFRLNRFNEDASWNGWFKDEQLTKEEMDGISNYYRGASFDLVLSHTCPISWQPTDLFISIDQSTVDNTMEKWLDGFKDSINWQVWLFGHFHADRLELPYVEMFYKVFEDLEDIMSRWRRYKTTGEIDSYIQTSPKFYN